MQKAARYVVIQKCFIHFVTRQHQRQGQIAAANAFGQAQQIGPHVRGHRLPRHSRLLKRKKSASAPTAHGYFIGNEQHLVLITQGARGAQIGGVVHHHTGRALH